MEGSPQGKGRKESLRMTNTNHNAKKKKKKWNLTIPKLRMSIQKYHEKS